MHVTAVTHRANPVYWAMLPGPPPNETSVIRQAMAGVFLPLGARTIPELVDYELPLFAPGGIGRCWRSARATPGRPAAWRPWPGACRRWRWPSFSWWSMRRSTSATIARCWRPWPPDVNPGRDVVVEEGPPDPWDAATPAGTLGCRLVIDATAKLPAERSAAPPAAGPDERFHPPVGQPIAGRSTD